MLPSPFLMPLPSERFGAPARRDFLLTASALLLPAALRAESGGGLPDPASLSAVLADLVPPNVGDQFRLARLDARGPGWRDLEIPAPQAGGPARTEKISVLTGARAMYSLPGGQWFVNLKLEQSQAGRYGHDRALCVEALRNVHALREAGSRRWLAGAGKQAREQLAARTLPGLPMAELEDAPHHGIETLAASENVYGASGVPTMAHLFLPSREVIVTVYLLHQKDTAVKSLAEFRALRDAFIDGYAQVLAGATDKDRAPATS